MTLANPEDVQLIPPGLDLQVYRHEVATAGGPVACFSYVTRNMSPLGQAEVVLTLRRHEGDHEQGLLRPPLELLKVIYEQAQQGRFVSAGGFTELGPAGLFGAGQMRGVAYVPTLPLEGVDGIDGALAMVLLTGEEIELTKAVGCWRVISRLGQASGFYPFPAYSERQRASFAIAGEAAESLLSQMPSLCASGSSVSQQQGWIVLQLHGASLGAIQQALTQLPLEAPLALLSAPNGNTPAGLVWRPGQEQAAAYTAPGADGSIIGGGFCAFVPEQEACSGQLFEDGFVVSLDNPTWAQLRSALQAGQNDDVAAQQADSLGLAVRWVDV